MWRGAVGALMLAICAACSATSSPAIATDSVAARTARLHQFAVMSQRTGQQYVIQVSEPVDALPAGGKAPVVYVTDGNWYFNMATDTVQRHMIDGGMGPTFVVAISYSDPSVENVGARREADLIHKPLKGATGMTGGGGDDFVAFLMGEVRPFIEGRFAVDPTRSVLAGQSFGGLFATNVLLEKPGSFYGYLIGSPSLWADRSLLAAARVLTGGEGRRVYIGVGGYESAEMRRDAKALAEALSARSTGLSVEHAELARLSHTNMQGAWFANGLLYLLPKSTGN